VTDPRAAAVDLFNLHRHHLAKGRESREILQIKSPNSKRALKRALLAHLAKGREQVGEILLRDVWMQVLDAHLGGHLGLGFGM